MEKNIILAGVGGQGILSIAYVIDNAALDAGFNFRQAEVHGMAQRGGSVEGYIRFGSDVHSPLTPRGYSHVMLAFEPIEAIRRIEYVGPKTVILVNDKIIPPPSVYRKKDCFYPEISEIKKILAFICFYLVDMTHGVKFIMQMFMEELLASL